MSSTAVPDVFEVEEDVSLLLLKEFPNDAERSEVQAAVGSYPTVALRIVKD